MERSGQIPRQDQIAVVNNTTSGHVLFDLGKGYGLVRDIAQRGHQKRIGDRVCEVFQNKGIPANADNVRFYDADEGPANPEDVSDMTRIQVYIDDVLLEDRGLIAELLNVIDQESGRPEEQEEELVGV